MIMHTTHYLNYGVFDVLLQAGARADWCPFCRQQMPNCDCGYGEIGLDEHPDTKKHNPKIAMLSQ